ncbi:MFS transporter [Dictyobacter arantiisoli]|uniref:MFS transporter n=1 Tax=Dictyobacter arantiisoli TaxID=2014874 RepID=A0A5A5TH09_9CHLR|nr:MFS transporter [Dictyobacter arantiisoli]GCF10353.1 MFS transporter [Dictyobacter arantiisoli]
MNATWSKWGNFARALQSRTFALLWLGQVFSAIGDGAYNTVLAWQVLITTGSGTAMGIVIIAANLPMLLLTLIGGVVADRFPRRTIILVTDLIRALALMLIVFLGTVHWLLFWHLVVLSLILGAAKGFFYPAYQSLPPDFVSKDALPSANALVSLSRQTSDLIGPLVGAACVALVGTLAGFALDGVTFIISSACVLLTFVLSQDALTGSRRLSPSQNTGFLKHFAHEIVEGIQYVVQVKWLGISILVASLANIAFEGSIVVALPKLIHDVYHSSVWILGSVTVTGSVGVACATVLSGYIQHLRRRGILAYGAVVICGIALACFGLPFSLRIGSIVVIVCNGIVGACLGFFTVIWLTLLQELVPEDKLGRINSIDLLGSLGLASLGYGIAGIVVDRVGPAQVFLVSGLLVFLLAASALIFRSIRNLQ